MSKDSEMQSELQQTTSHHAVSKAGLKKSQRAQKERIDILLLIDRVNLDTAGFEDMLAGLGRLLPTETSRLHVCYLEQKKTGAPEIASRGTEEMLDRIRACLERSDFEVMDNQWAVWDSSMMSKLVDEVKRSDYDLLVLCSPELSSVVEPAQQHFIQYIASHAPTSVLVWRKPLPRKPYPLKALLGVDGSESSLTAVTKSPNLLYLKYAHLIAASALTPFFQENAVTAPFINPSLLEQALDNNARIVFEMTTGILESKGLQKPVCKKLSGSPATELGYFAELENPDVIIVGSHNRKGLFAWLLGSVSTQLLQWDTHNLLIVR